MIYIEKQTEPVELRDFKYNNRKKLKNLKWESNEKFVIVKNAIRRSLCKEQNNLCAYCNRKIDNNCQIEHYIPRCKDNTLTWEYSNMLGVDNTRDKGIENESKKREVICENNKKNQIININPLDKQMMQEIYYLENGKIKHDKYQSDLDEILKLNNIQFMEQRKTLLKTFKSNFTTKLFDYDKALNYFINGEGKSFPFKGILIWYINSQINIK